MNSVEDAARVVTARLPSGIPVKVEVTGPDSGGWDDQRGARGTQPEYCAGRDR